jgi:O-antigen/teichoic acid export membrane protein
MRTRLLGILIRPAVAGAVSVLLLRGLTLASRFLLSLLLARMLSPAEMGQYGLLTAALAFALLGIGLEFYTFTLREMVAATPVGQARIIANQIALGAVALLILGVLVLIIVSTGLFPLRLAPWFFLILITEHVSLEATRVLIISSRPVRAYVGIFLRGGIWVYALAALMHAEPSSRTLEAVLIWWIGGGIASIVLSAISLADLPWRELKGYRPDWKMIFVGLRTARPFMLTAVGASIISYVDRFIIDGVLGKDALGIYTFYSTILIGLLSLGGSISHQFLPKIISGYSTGQNAYRIALRSFFLSLFIVATGSTIISGLAMAPTLNFLGLPAYESNVRLFYALLPGVFLRILADVPSYALYAARSDRYLMYCNLGAALLSMLLNVMLIPIFALYGAALTGGISSAFLLASLTLAAMRKIDGDRGKPPVARSDRLPTGPDMLVP